MKSFAVVVLVAFAVCCHGSPTRRGKVELPEGRNGGVSCAGCTALLAIVEQRVEFKNSTVVDTLDGLCDLLPKEVYASCKLALTYLGPSLIKLILHNNGPDVICHALNFCFTDPGQPMCKTITPPMERASKLSFEMKVAKAKSIIRPELKKFPEKMSICEVPGIDFICEWLNRTWTHRLPLDDFDGDGFSPSMAFRGSTWRGKDCSDFSSAVHPGAIPLNHDVFGDSNCNGIYGINKVTKQSYEDELCSSSQPKGIATLGDSISAHFSFPQTWIDATKLSAELFKPFTLALMDEFDWPMMSQITGHGNNSWTDVVPGPIDSIYNRMVQRNRCNHRDYQNIAVNGGDSFNVHNVMDTLSRDQTSDRPLMVFIVLLGNDVCQGKSQSLDDMTTPKQMYANTLETLAFLDHRLPAKSSVMILGLADGRILYEAMHARTHPIANFWKDFKYSEFYDYLMCLEISPCLAWMTSNSTARDRGAQRVVALNKVLEDLATKRKTHYSNFNLFYMDDPLNAVLKDWEDEGGEPWQLIEASDGFHSNQMGQALTSRAIWDNMAANFPEVLGPVNPHNEQIKKLFGDQGGL